MKFLFSILFGLLLAVPAFSQEAPNDFFVDYHMWGWYGPPCNDIRYHISKDSSYFEVLCLNSHVNRIPVNISEEELNKIYSIIKENNFKNILAENRDYIVTDLGYSRMEINLDNVNHVVFTDGENHINIECRYNYSEITKAIVQLFPDLKKQISLQFDEELKNSETPFSISFDNGNFIYRGSNLHAKDITVNLFEGKNSFTLIYGKTQNQKTFVNIPHKVKEIYFFLEDDKIKFKIK